MTPDKSTIARPWFIVPTWARIVPLLVHTIATDPEGDEAQASALELGQLAEGLDSWNSAVQLVLPLLSSAIDRLDKAAHIDNDKIQCARADVCLAIKLIRREA